MKRITISVILIFVVMAVFCEDMSFYTDLYMMPDGTIGERRAILEQVRDEGITGIGEFYHEALKFFLLRAPNIQTRMDQDDAEKSALIMCNGLAAEKYQAAAGELWQIVEMYDISKQGNNGTVMQAALIAVGQVNGADFIPHLVQRLNELNDQVKIVSDLENRNKIKLAAEGCINALETLKDIRGYKPIFYAYIGVHDSETRQAASNALPNLVDDPCDVLIEIIQEPSSEPGQKLTAFNEMLRTRAPNTSKAKVAASALNMGWIYMTQTQSLIRILREMRKEAIKAIGQFGAADNSVYENMEKSYSANFTSVNPDHDEVMFTLNTLTALKTDEAVALLYKFLTELHGKRRNGPWTVNKERRYFDWIIQCLGKTKTQNVQVRILLTTISRNAAYTPQEQGMARSALNVIASR